MECNFEPDDTVEKFFTCPMYGWNTYANDNNKKSQKRLSWLGRIFSSLRKKGI